MASIDAIAIKDERWKPLLEPDEPGARSWTNGGDRLQLRFFPLPPDLPAPLSRPDLLWKIGRLETFWRQAAPVDMFTGIVGGTEYLAQIVKFSFNGRVHYQASLIIPRGSFSFTFIIGAEGDAADGEREKHVEEAVLGGVTDVDERARRWFVDPFEFAFVTPFGRNRADDEEWDEIYPSHPLSRIRSILRELPAALAIAPEVARSPAFVAPAPTPESEERIADYADMFTVNRTEQAELDTLSNSLREKIESLISQTGLDHSTDSLSVEQPVYAKADAEEFRAQFKDRAPSASHLFADAIAGLAAEQDDPKICLIMYSSKRDPTFYRSISALSALHAAKHNDPKAFHDAEILASTEALNSEFIISRLLRAMNVRCVAVRSARNDKCRTGTGLIAADEEDWFGKFITLCELSGMIVCATMFNPNLCKEVGVTFGLDRNRAKFLYRSSDDKFHLGSQQEHAFDIRQLPEVWGYLVANKLGIPVSITPRRH